MKRILSIVLSLSLLLSVTTTSFALSDVQNNYSTTKTESNGIFVTVTSDSESEHIIEYDSIKNTVQASTKDLVTGEITYGPVISTVETAQAQSKSDEVYALAGKIHQDTFLNYEYDMWPDTLEWNLERPDDVFSQAYFRTYQNSLNSDQLGNWKTAVDDLNDQEWVVIGALSVSAWSIVKAAITSKAAIASGGILTLAAKESIIAAAGATGAAAIAIGALVTDFNNCTLTYNAVKRATDNTTIKSMYC